MIIDAHSHILGLAADPEFTVDYGREGSLCIYRSMGKLPSQLWLFVASLFFYGWWNPVYVTLIIASMLFNFYLGRYLLMKQDKKALIVGIAAG